AQQRHLPRSRRGDRSARDAAMDRAGTEIASTILSSPGQESRADRFLVISARRKASWLGGNMSGTEANDAHAYTADETAYLAHVRSIQGQSWPAEVPRKLVYPLGERPITEYLSE